MERTKNRKKRILTAVLAVVLTAVMAGTALAYFTDYDRADGVKPVDMSWTTTVREKMDGNNKHIVIENTGKTDTIVRAAIYADERIATTTDVKGNWTKQGDWWYYTKVLAAGESTTELYVSVEAEKLPEYDFNIIVVHESSRTVYDEDNNLIAPGGDWAYVPAAEGGQS